ncbi:MAG: ABC transporter substrate-binding protein, partial [Anaerolineae bacterium]|nr:ABC transporter substrate-binding protein [Anaerolineae bacterium]
MNTRTRKLLFAAVAVLIIGVVLISGCTPPTAEVIEKVVTQVITETVRETVVVEGTSTVVEKEVEKIVEVTATPDQSVTGVMKPVPRNRTVVLGAWEHAAQLAGTDNFNPIVNIPSLRTNYAKFVYEALMYYNLTSGEYYPWLAEEFTIDDDYMGMDIYLRKGVEWADGEPFTCDDVKFTIEAHINTDNARWKGYFTEWVDSIECIDDFTVRINYTNSNPRFHQKIMIGWENHFVIVPEHIFADKDVGTFTNLDLGRGWPMGSGPYKLILVTPNQVIYDRRDDWWGAKIGFMDLPIPERIVGTNAASDEAYAQLYMTDKLDFGGFALQIGSFEAAKERNPNVRSWYPEGPVYGAPDGCMYQLILNNARFDDVNVRLALNYALDRQEVVDLAYQGATFPKAYPISMYVEGAWGALLQPVIDKYDRGAAPNMDKVEEYMTAAGYEKNG